MCVFNAFILFVLYISQLRKDNVVRKMRMVKTELGKNIHLMNLVWQIQYCSSHASPLDSFLAHSSHSVKTCWMNKWKSSCWITNSYLEAPSILCLGEEVTYVKGRGVTLWQGKLWLLPSFALWGVLGYMSAPRWNFSLHFHSPFRVNLGWHLLMLWDSREHFCKEPCFLLIALVIWKN